MFYYDPYYDPYGNKVAINPLLNPVQLTRFVGFMVDIQMNNGQLYCNVRLDSVSDWGNAMTNPNFGGVQITRFVNGIPQQLPLHSRDIQTITQAGQLCRNTQPPFPPRPPNPPRPPRPQRPPWCRFAPPGFPGC